MKVYRVRLIGMCLIASLLICAGGQAMVLELPSGGGDLVASGQRWSFLRGREPASAPPEAWREVDFDDAAWETGPSGFGFGDADDATFLDDMQGEYATVYIRKEFSVASVDPAATLELAIDYDDGFIAYLNGREAARRHMPAGAVTHATFGTSHEAGTPEIIPLGPAGDWLREGSNVLAIEGHNSSLSSTDFSLDPALRTVSGALRNGAVFIVTTQSVRVIARTTVGSVASIVIGEVVAARDAQTGVWKAEIALAPGLNVVSARAFDAQAREIDSGSMQVVYLPEANRLTGELTEDATLSGAWLLHGVVTIPAGKVLKIQSGTVVLMERGSSILVEGQLLASGTPAAPICFTHYGDGTAWKQIKFVEAADSRFDHCTFEHADSAGSHQDYYEPGPRDYHEAIVVLACHLDVNDCTFQKLPDESANAEGDAIAVIADDPNHPGAASAHIRGCRFLGIGQGIHTRHSYVLVEDCYFTGKHGDNDDVDLWGESTPPPLIRHNTFWYPEHDDAINPTRCSAVIVGNLIVGTDDHGMVLRDKASPILINNVVVDCANGGIAIENSNTAYLLNNTIVDCGRGLRLFDLGRWGPPYRLNPGGGTATVVNCIIWDCPQPVALADSSNTGIADRGSHVTILHSIIQRGRNGVSVSGSQSTVVWGEGNFDTDPLFVDAGNLDFHLLAGSPAIDKANTEAPETDRDGNPRPFGPAADMGAYEFMP